MSALSYVPSTEVFGDFLVGPTGLSLPLDRQDPLEGGLSLYSNGLPRPPLRGETAMFGIARIEDGLVVGPTVIAGQHSMVTGQCAMVFNGPKTIVAADFLGMAPLFYCVEKQLISNRLHLIVLALRTRGALRPDIGAIAAGLSTASNIGQQLATWRTQIEGVVLLGPDQHLELGEKWRVVRTVQDHSPLEPDEYKALIRKGAEDVALNVKAALDYGLPVRCTLTGGRDSRVLLAAVVALGRVRDVPFVTMQIDDADVKIASGLVKLFGGHYATGALEFRPLDPAAVLAKRRSVYLGLYHPVSGLGSHSAHDPHIRLVGGCGELFRTINFTFNRQLAEEKADIASLKKMFRKRGLASNLAEPYDDLALETLSQTFISLDGTQIRDKLNDHYRSFRSRFHFGLTGYYRSGLRWHPMASPYLLRAARGLPYEIRAKGRVTFDVARELCDLAAYLPFDSPRPDWQDRYHTPHKYDAVHFDPTSASELVTRAAVGRNRPAQKISTQYAKIMAQQMRESLDRLQSHPVLSNLITNDVLTRIPHRRSMQNRWYSKLSGLADTFE